MTVWQSTAQHQPALSRPVLAERLLPRTATRTGLTVLGAAALIALAARVSIPIPGTPVPITGQTFAVLLTAAALGPARGIAAQLVYILAGVVGMPVFAGAAHGTAVVFGASGGYLVAYPLAALIVGYFARRGADRSVLRTLAVYAVASAVIYAIGTLWLCVDTGMSASAGIAAGVTPFLPGDAVKALLAAGLLPAAWKLVGRSASTKAEASTDRASTGRASTASTASTSQDA
ncbi:MAG TPA: biotin transporter BioY [Trebonia sp.]|jgi:biotin transport system substrate-specific component